MTNVIRISGRNAIRAACQQGLRFHELYLAPGRSQSPEGLLSELGFSQSSPPFKVVDKKRLASLIGHPRHQGLVAEVTLALPTVADLVEVCEENSGILVALDHLEDPQNAGAILRTVAGLGLNGLLLSEHRGAPLGDGLVRSSAGVALTHPPALLPGSLADLCLRLSRRGWEILGLQVTGQPIGTFVRQVAPALLVIGGEHLGLRPLVAKRCSTLLTIPMDNGVESLNASVAAGIAMALLRAHHPPDR